jgi:unsaturated rhamnogalacturonyl hydrolase
MRLLARIDIAHISICCIRNWNHSLGPCRTAFGIKWIYPNQIWLVGLYMQGTFYLRYAFLNDRVEQCLEDMVSQCELIFGKTHDQQPVFFFHAWDESRQMAWSDSRTGLSQCFWSRAIVGIAWRWSISWILYPKKLDLTPIEALAEIGRRFGSSFTRCQDPGTGLWWQVLDQGGRGKNYLESSAQRCLSISVENGTKRMVVQQYCSGCKSSRLKGLFGSL